jgi:hypothetical protein
MMNWEENSKTSNCFNKIKSQLYWSKICFEMHREPTNNLKFKDV